MWQIASLFFLISCFPLISVFADVLVVRHIRPSEKDSRLNYRLELLELAFKKTQVPYKLVPVESSMPISRAFLEMNHSKPLLDIISGQTSIDREAKLRPIRFPIDRGVMGLRVFLVQPKNQNLFKSIQTLEDLKKFDFGLMKSWLDTDLFRDAGLKVVYASKYESLFEMVAAGRFSALSRSVAEVTAEKKMFGVEKNPLVIETNLLLQYPAAEYFFVREKDEKLYQTVSQGLSIAFSDGSFFKLFDKYFANDFAALRIKQRRVIKIPNSYLSKQVLDVDPRWWYQQ